MAVTRSGWQERTQLLQTPPSSSLTSIKHIHITTSGGHAEVLSWASGTVFRNLLSGWSSCTHFFIVFDKDELTKNARTLCLLEKPIPFEAQCYYSSWYHFSMQIMSEISTIFNWIGKTWMLSNFHLNKVLTHFKSGFNLAVEWELYLEWSCAIRICSALLPFE